MKRIFFCLLYFINFFCVSQNHSEIGPKDIPIYNTTSAGNGIGRVNHFKIDPLDNTRMFASSSHGGMFYSIDGGANWKNSGTDALPKIGISTTEVVHNPNDLSTPIRSNTWFVATGDRDKDGVQNSIGIYRRNYINETTTSNWTIIADVTNFNSISNSNLIINKIISDPNNANILYAATSKGLFRSCNALNNTSGPTQGVTWTLITVPNPSSGIADIHDIEFKPGQAASCNICGISQSCSLYVSGKGGDGTFGIWSTNNSGTSWSNLNVASINASLMENSEWGRVVIEVTPNASDNLYALIAYPVNSNIRSSVYVKVGANAWINKGDFFNGGTSPVTQGNNPDVSKLGIFPPFAYSFAVSPTNKDHIAACSVYPLVICTTATASGTANWISTNYNANVNHADAHFLNFSPNGSTLWLSNDGGLSSAPYSHSSPSSTNFTYKSKGLGISTIYSISSSPISPYLIGMGAQDDGINIYNGTNSSNGSWSHEYGGDGYVTRFDNLNVNNFYFQSNSIIFNTSLSNHSPSYIGSTKSSNKNTLALHNSKENTSYFLNSNDAVFRQRNQVLENISTSNLNPSLNINLTNIQQAYLLYSTPANPDFLYAMIIYNGGIQKIYKSQNVNAINTEVSWVDLNNPKSNHFLKDLCIDYDNPNIVYAIFSDNTFYKYDPINGWVIQNKTINNTTINSNSFVSPGYVSLVNERGSNGGFYLGTTLGVYYTNNTLPNWQYYVGPNNSIMDLEINYTNNKLRIGSYGRGAWECDLMCPSISTLNSIGAGFNEVTGVISSTQTLSQSTVFTARAGTGINLNPGFKFIPTSTGYFKGFIHPCNISGNSYREEADELFNEDLEVENTDNLNSVSIIPNPNNGEFKLVSKNSSFIKDIKIFNIQGIPVYEAKNLSVEQFEIKNKLPNGSYYSIVTTNKELKIIKFIVIN